MATVGVGVGVGAGASAAVPGLYERDATISWFQSEFAAANAIIDGLCGHLAQIGSEDEYRAFFAAVHRRRLNWIPVLHMQKYYSIADVFAELRLVASNRVAPKVNPLQTLTAEEKLRESESPSTETETASLKGAVADDIEIVVTEEAAAEDQETSNEMVDDDNEIARIDDEASATAELSSGVYSSEYKINAEDGDANGGNKYFSQLIHLPRLLILKFFRSAFPLKWFERLRISNRPPLLVGNFEFDRKVPISSLLPLRPSDVEFAAPRRRQAPRSS